MSLYSLKSLMHILQCTTCYTSYGFNTFSYSILEVTQSHGQVREKIDFN